jgi:hypothetical protein
MLMMLMHLLAVTLLSAPDEYLEVFPDPHHMIIKGGNISCVCSSDPVTIVVATLTSKRCSNMIITWSTMLSCGLLLLFVASSTPLHRHLWFVVLWDEPCIHDEQVADACTHMMSWVFEVDN